VPRAGELAGSIAAFALQDGDRNARLSKATSSDGAAESAPDHDRLIVIVSEPRGAHQAAF
jgi:hypothetical protein